MMRDIDEKWIVTDIDGQPVVDDDPGEDIDLGIAIEEYAKAIDEYNRFYASLPGVDELERLSKRVDEEKEIVKATAQAILQQGESVSSGGYTVRINNGRESVDVKAFKGYCVAHPDAVQLIKEGIPYVVITKDKG